MNNRFIFVIAFLLSAVYGCHSSSKTTTVISEQTKPAVAKKNDATFVFSLRLRVVKEYSAPFDDIFIDTTGQMIFETNQQMKSGDWRKPKGFAYLNLKDEDNLVSFIRRSSLFQIDPSDVKPECPSGEVLMLTIYRSDLRKTITFETNLCVVNTNLLTGEQRKYFPLFITFLQRVRDVYRPQLQE